MKHAWDELSDSQVEQIYLSRCVQNVQWTLGRCAVEGDQLCISGWAIALAGEPENATFLLNGKPFHEVHYPLSSPDLGTVFWNLDAAKTAGFSCRTPIEEGDFDGCFARLEFLDASPPEHVRRRAWYFPAPAGDLPLPEEGRIRRVIGIGDTEGYLLGGATIYKRLEHYLEHTLSVSLHQARTVLDWACGCGRVTRSLRFMRSSTVWGVDIDRDNLTWCRRYLRHGRFAQTSTVPPLPFPDGCFDVVLAISVMSQIREEHQLLWLRELSRVCKKHAFVLAAVPGPSKIALERQPASFIRRVERSGFLATGRNPDLDDVLPNQTSYISGLHSRPHLEAQFGRFFTIVDIVDALAANDDLVVMRNDRPSHS